MRRLRGCDPSKYENFLERKSGLMIHQFEFVNYIQNLLSI